MHTFDVFDTLITRTTATPKGIFAIMQNKLQHSEEYKGISGYIKDSFYSLRVHAEELARARAAIAGMEEILLEQIYEALGTTGCLSLEEMEQLMELERITEYENSVGILGNIARVKELVQQGEPVILLSDMYLNFDIIQGMLIKADPVFLHIPLYVSSQYMQAKWTGNLYKLLKNKGQADYGTWIHYGDNPLVDVKAAAKLGIQAKLIPFEPLKPYEKKVLETTEDDVFIQLTIGTARNTRLMNKLNGPAAMGASIGGAILIPYVWWVLQESLEKGIRRLYFIARDGYVLKEIADRLIAENNFDIETYYIYGSRRAWRMPSFSERNANLYRFVGWSYAKNIKNIIGLADVLQIPVEELLPFLPGSMRDGSKKLTTVLVAELIKMLEGDVNFKEYLCERHMDNRHKVVRYLKQEIDLSGDEFAFVDLSGGGFTQGCLAEIMSDFYDEKIRTFYLRMDRLNLMDNCISYNFLPSFLDKGLILEMLCRAPHGQTIGYREEQNGIIPEIKEDGEGEALIQHGFYEYTKGIMQFVEIYMSLMHRIPLRADSLKLLLHYMEYITKSPDPEVLAYFGDMPNGVTGREHGVVKFAPVLTRKEIRSLFLYRTDEPIERYYPGSSLEYSLLRSSSQDKNAINFFKKHHSTLLGKLLRLPKTIGKGLKSYSLASEFPCELLGHRVVLYGAGKLGQELVMKINRSGTSRVVLWVDRDYENCRKMGLEVSNPQDIRGVEFDTLVIGVLNGKVAEQIRTMLMQMSIPNEKIKWIDLWPKWE